MSTHPQSFGSWYDKYLNRWPLMLDDRFIHTVGIAWLFKDWYGWRFIPRITGDHQYYNAQFFLRFSPVSLLMAIAIWWCFGAAWVLLAIPLSLVVPNPFAFFFGMRLSATHLLQIGLGWKQNGRFAVHLRHQTDESAARGTHSPNYGHAAGWDYGEH